MIPKILIPALVLPLSFVLDSAFGLILTGYLVLQVAYSFGLKNVVIVDVMVIAAGFVLRVAAGVPLVQAERFSPWLYLFTTLGALFLALGKRRPTFWNPKRGQQYDDRTKCTNINKGRHITCFLN